MKDQNRIRVFVAAEIPDQLRKSIYDLQVKLKPLLPAARWTDPGSIHITLKFLGDVPVSKVEKIGKTMPDWIRDIPAFALQPSGLGVFPDARSARVLWIGSRFLPDSLTGIVESLEANLSRMGFPREKRRFACHITIARFKYFPDSFHISSILDKYKEWMPDPVMLKKIILFQSHLTPGGAVYTPLFTQSLT